jgi:hypothetical protein
LNQVTTKTTKRLSLLEFQDGFLINTGQRFEPAVMVQKGIDEI